MLPTPLECGIFLFSLSTCPHKSLKFKFKSMLTFFYFVDYILNNIQHGLTESYTCSVFWSNNIFFFIISIGIMINSVLR